MKAFRRSEKDAVSRSRLLEASFFSSLLLVAAMATAQEAKKEYGVYQYVLQPALGSFDSISAALESGAAATGWRLLAKVDAGVPEQCPYRARVFVLFDSVYVRQIMAANRTTGPFAVLDRINLFEDENGIHVAVVNPHSINRTILMDDREYEAITGTHLQALRQMINGAVPGTASEKQFGQMREKGYIGKTMGVMAGGKFIDKIQDEAVVRGVDWKTVAGKVRHSLSQPGTKWGMRLVYELELPEYETVVFGSTGTPMDSKSFSIVKAGGDKSRKELQCPGLAHAAAYPIEVVVAREGEEVRVRLVNVMFRMKMYFEDAGKMAFMKNMGMPGSIQDELKGQFLTALGMK